MGKLSTYLAPTHSMSVDGKNDGQRSNIKEAYRHIHGQPNIDNQYHDIDEQDSIQDAHRTRFDNSKSRLSENQFTLTKKIHSITPIPYAIDPDVLKAKVLQTRQSNSGEMQSDIYETNQDQSATDVCLTQAVERSLGGIEKMYYHSIKEGQDMISLMDKIHSVYPIKEAYVKQALNLLMLRHPLLRMSIKSLKKPSGAILNFIRRDDMECDFYATDRKDWLSLILEEVQTPFDDDNKPLWRCRMLEALPIQDKPNNHGSQSTHTQTDSTQTSQETKHGQPKPFRFKATFVFILHHSIMDGRYSLWIFHDFIRLLDAITLGTAIDMLGLNELPLLPPMEQCFISPSQDKQHSKLEKSKSYLEFCNNESNNRVLLDYKSRYSNEIMIQSQQKPRNSFLTFRCSNDKTKQFIAYCKARNVSINGAFVTASIFALRDLVYPDRNYGKKYEIPFEYMLDLRRFYDRSISESQVPTYPGVMSYPVPMKAFIDSNDHDERNFFWETARQFGESLHCDIDSPEILQWVHNEARRLRENPQQSSDIGKSPFVLCLSNMGRLDHVIQGDLAERIRLVDIHGHSSILINDMPLFFVSAYTLNGHFCGNISYCEGFTSSTTASQYTGHLLKYVHDCSNL